MQGIQDFRHDHLVALSEKISYWTPNFDGRSSFSLLKWLAMRGISVYSFFVYISHFQTNLNSSCWLVTYIIYIYNIYIYIPFYPHSPIKLLVRATFISLVIFPSCGEKSPRRPRTSTPRPGGWLWRLIYDGWLTRGYGSKPFKTYEFKTLPYDWGNNHPLNSYDFRYRFTPRVLTHGYPHEICSQHKRVIQNGTWRWVEIPIFRG